MKELKKLGIYKGVEFKIFEMNDLSEKIKEVLEIDVDSYLLGYVKVPKRDKHFMEIGEENFEDIECHGGITYSDYDGFELKGHWIGFDLSHPFSKDVHNDLEFATNQCFLIIDQLLEN